MKKQLIFALDGMESDLVQKWMAEKKMLIFSHLLNNGNFFDLSSIAQYFPDNVWPACYASATPAHFKRYYYVQYDQNIQNLKLLQDDNYEHPFDFRKILSQNGYKIVTMDLAKDYLLPNLNGIQIMNWGCHGAKGKKCSSPENLIQEIEKKFGVYPTTDCDAIPANPKDHKKLLEDLLLSIHRRTNIYQYLLQNYDYNIFCLGYSEAHCAGHQLWQYMDKQKGDVILQQAIESIYIAIDESIGKLLSSINKDVAVLLTSVHGMAPLCHASWNIGEILDLLGYGDKTYQAKKEHAAKINPWLWLKLVIPSRLQYLIKKMLPKKLQNELVFRWYAGKRNWKNRKAFAVPNNDSVGAIRINLKGRDKYGIVPQEEYQNICQEIVDKLHQLTDPDTGKKIVSEAVIIRNKFQGEFINNFPDITIHWESSFMWNKIISPEFPTLTIKKQDNRTGSHSNKGFAITNGYSVGIEKNHSMFDIAPTILKQSKIAIPKEYEGKTL